MKKFFIAFAFLLVITPLAAMQENLHDNHNKKMITKLYPAHASKENDNNITIHVSLLLDKQNELTLLTEKKQNSEPLFKEKTKRCKISSVVFPTLVLLISGIMFGSVIGVTINAFVNRRFHNGTSPNSTSIF